MDAFNLTVIVLTGLFCIRLEIIRRAMVYRTEETHDLVHRCIRENLYDFLDSKPKIELYFDLLYKKAIWGHQYHHPNAAVFRLALSLHLWTYDQLYPSAPSAFLCGEAREEWEQACVVNGASFEIPPVSATALDEESKKHPQEKQ